MSFDQNCFTALVQTTVQPPLTATSLQQPLFFVPADNPYIGFYLNLSTTATASKLRPQLSKKPVDHGQFFQRLTKKSGMVAKFDPYGALLVNLILIMFHLF